MGIASRWIFAGEEGSIMEIELIKATHKEQPMLANLLELYAYDLSSIWPFDIGDNGFYGYKYLHLYFKEPNRYPFIIKVYGKIAGFVLAQYGSHLENTEDYYDIAEFFILRKYRKKGVGKIVAHRIFQMFYGKWQVRVFKDNIMAHKFWDNTIKDYTKKEIEPIKLNIDSEEWLVYRF
jgi:predicted acetyltransferase